MSHFCACFVVSPKIFFYHRHKALSNYKRCRTSAWIKIRFELEVVQVKLHCLIAWSHCDVKCSTAEVYTRTTEKQKGVKTRNELFLCCSFSPTAVCCTSTSSTHGLLLLKGHGQGGPACSLHLLWSDRDQDHREVAGGIWTRRQLPAEGQWDGARGLLSLCEVSCSHTNSWPTASCGHVHEFISSFFTHFCQIFSKYTEIFNI